MPSSSRGRPVVFFVHGGGWKRFSKRMPPIFCCMHQNVARSLARRGYLVVSTNYRLSMVPLGVIMALYSVIGIIAGCITLAALGAPRASDVSAIARIVAAACVPVALAALGQVALRGGFGGGDVLHPTHTQDVAAALRWTIDNVAAFGGDASNVAVMGHSAGAHIVANLLAVPSYAKAAGVDDLRAHVTAGVLLSGVYDAGLLVRPYGTALWHWPSIAFRKAWFVQPAFGMDASQWEDAFACAHLSDATTVKDLKLPPLMLVNAAVDAGLGMHTDKLEEQLQAADAEYERYTLQRTDHITYVLGMDKPGWYGEVVATPLIVRFLQQRMIRPDRSEELKPENVTLTPVAGRE